MAVKEIVSKLLEEEEKLEWWFEQDIDKEEERFEGDEDGGKEGQDTEKEVNSASNMKIVLDLVIKNRGGRGRRPREGNDERVEDLNDQGNDKGLGANGGVEGVNGNIEGANRGAPDFSTIIA
ncbi:hypothetical protein Tco_0903323 [Tanacetum coccineum]